MADEPREGFEDWLPVSPKRTGPGEYNIVSAEGRVLWSMEGASLAEWVCDVLNRRAPSEVERQSGAADGRDVLSAAVKFRQVMRSGRDAGAGADAYFTYAEALREFSEAVDQFLAAPGETGEGEG